MISNDLHLIISWCAVQFKELHNGGFYLYIRLSSVKIYRGNQILHLSFINWDVQCCANVYEAVCICDKVPWMTMQQLYACHLFSSSRSPSRPSIDLSICYTLLQHSMFFHNFILSWWLATHSWQLDEYTILQYICLWRWHLLLIKAIVFTWLRHFRVVSFC